MKQKNKLFIIVRIAIGLVAVIGIAFLGLFLFYFFTDDSKPSNDEIAAYNYLAENYTGLVDSFKGELPIEEIKLPVPGVDYEPEDIATAFEEYYSDQGVAGAGSGYREVIKNPQNAGLIKKKIKPKAGPDAWVALGDSIINSIDEGSADYVNDDLYKVLNNPLPWIASGDLVVADIDSKISNSGKMPPSKDLTATAIEAISRFVKDKDATKDMSGLTDLITAYIDEQYGDIEVEVWDEYTENYFDGKWDDYRHDPVPENIPTSPDTDSQEFVYIKAEDYPINYKVFGRQFYRETLDESQKLAYDIAATILQAGLFDVDCEFGISAGAAADAFEALRRDFPEFFYTTGCAVSVVDIAGNARGVVFGIKKYFEEIGVDKALRQLAEKVNPVVAEAGKLNSDIDKIKYIVDYMCSSTVYSKFDPMWVAKSGKTISDMQDLWSCIIDGETVCAGYADAFHYYMNRLGIPAAKMISTGHGWNIIEIDGDYYYMDVTWVDCSGSYYWFNFNEKLLDAYKEDESFIPGVHDRVGLSASLPQVNGTKYGYENWFGPLEPPAEQPPAPYLPPAASASVIINGYDVSANIGVVKEGGVLYAKGEALVQSFADLGAQGSPHWFTYEFNSKDDEVYIGNSGNGNRLLTLHLYSDLATRYENNEYAEELTVSAKVQKYVGEVYIPILSFSESIGKVGYEVEIVIDGKSYSFAPKTASARPEPSKDPKQTDTPDDSQSDPGDSHKEWDIPERWESSELIQDWSQGPTSLWESMKKTDVISGLAGTYVGYYRYTPNQIVMVFNEDNATGYCDELDSEWPADYFKFSILFDVDHPMVDNIYNGIIMGESTDASNNYSYELVVVSPTILYEPASETIFYKVD